MDQFEHLEKKVRLISKEVDSLQVKILSETKPWYRQASILIALFALVFSFGSTLISNKRAVELDERAMKQELRGLVLQLVQQPLKGIELNEKYKDQPLFLGNLSGLFTQESLILAEQASVVTQKIPELVSSAEYATIANAFYGGGQPGRAKKIRDKAIEVAKVPIDAVNALRQQGIMAFQMGNLDMARSYYSDALSIFDRFPETDLGVIDFTNAYTHMFWAQQEAIYNQCTEFSEQISLAKEYVERLSIITKEQLLAQVRKTESQGCPRVNNLNAVKN